MAWTAPNTFVAGAVLTAAQMNAMQANALAGGPIYATEALRDAAITAPFEGQRAYITGSTETTAAGLSTQIPTGIQTIYNGTGWVTVTQVGGINTNAGTTTSATLTTTITGLTGATPSATLRTGTTALVSILSRAVPPAAAGNGYVDLIVSGASSITPSVASSRIWVQNNTGYNLTANGTFIVPGLTAGVNTFTFAVAAQSGTLSIYGPQIIVQGIA